MPGINSIAFSNFASSVTNGQSAQESAKFTSDGNKFNDLVQSFKAKQSDDTRLNGDIASGFAGTYTSEADKHSKAVGAAASSKKTIDRTSKLYEKSLELESYVVKMMLKSMRSTVGNSSLSGEKSYATKMYEDMLYDEYATSMTKNAGFGLADQVYLSLV